MELSTTFLWSMKLNDLGHSNGWSYEWIQLKALYRDGLWEE